MPWVRLDDGYPEHPKVDRVGPLAAWLNVCAWAYCARNLTDGFVPAERVGRLAQVHNHKQLVAALLSAELWECADKPCAKCTTKREEVHAPAIAGAGYLVHDYLDYNPSRDQIMKERAEAAQRAADYRARRANSVGSSVSSGVTNAVTEDVTHPVSHRYPVPGPVIDAPNGAVRGPVPKPNRSSQVIDSIRALGQEPTLTDRDHAAIKRSTAKPELIAEVYCAIFRGDYGDEFMQRHLCVREAIGWIDGYRSWKTSGTPKQLRVSRPDVPRLIDRTGIQN